MNKAPHTFPNASHSASMNASNGRQRASLRGMQAHHRHHRHRYYDHQHYPYSCNAALPWDKGTTNTNFYTTFPSVLCFCFPPLWAEGYSSSMQCCLFLRLVVTCMNTLLPIMLLTQSLTVEAAAYVGQAAQATFKYWGDGGGVAQTNTVLAALVSARIDPSSQHCHSI